MIHSTCVDLLPKKVLLGGSGILMYIGLKLVSKNKTAFSHSKDAVISQLCFFNPNHAKPMWWFRQFKLLIIILKCINRGSI